MGLRGEAAVARSSPPGRRRRRRRARELASLRHAAPLPHPPTAQEDATYKVLFTGAYAGLGAPTQLTCYTQFTSTTNANYTQFLNGPGTNVFSGYTGNEPVVSTNAAAAAAYYNRWSTSGVAQWRVSCVNYGNASAPWVVTYPVSTFFPGPNSIVTFPIPTTLLPTYVLSTLFYGGLYVSGD